MVEVGKAADLTKMNEGVMLALMSYIENGGKSDNTNDFI